MGIQIWTTDISNIFLWWPVDNPRLPSAYQEVEYLESSWTQFIETDVNNLTAPFKVEVKYMKQNTGTSDQTLVGQRQLWKFVNIYNNYYENLWSNSASWTASWDNNIHTIITDSSAWLYKDWTLLVSGTSWNRSSSYNALIFAFSEDSAANAKWLFKGRIYEVKITNNGVLYRHYIPCYRKSDNVIWMYELVAGTFKTNAWSWTFAKWSNVDTNVYQKFKEVYVWTTKVRPSATPITTAWIYHNPGLWLISLSSDWTNWTTIADKNVWSTVAGTWADSYWNYYSWSWNTDCRWSVTTSYTPPEDWTIGYWTIIPTWYHIPTTTECTDLLLLYQTITWKTTTADFQADLLIPKAWQKQASQTTISYGWKYPYWRTKEEYSSSNWYFFRIASLNIWNVAIWTGFSVRAFKDSWVQPDGSRTKLN